MRKKSLSVLTVLFLGMMLFGTLFHKKIDGMFREQVTVVNPRIHKEMVTQTWETGGEKREFTTEETCLLVPKSAVSNNMVYVLETVEVPYGSYEVVWLKYVELTGEAGDSIKIKSGLKENDRVVAEFGENLANGMRVVVE